ncbi:MAG TPA: glycosyltransferase [Pirellulaceae bacterium]|nr:glycosyltransferase [Pirellulaceae bacterium]
MKQLSAKRPGGRPEPLRLALVITELEPGGAERCLVNLAVRLDRQRFAPVVYSLGRRPEPPKDLLVGQLEQAGVPVQFLDLRHWSQYAAGARRLAALMAQQRAEVVQTFLFHANVLGCRAARRAGVQHVFTGVRVADPRRWRTALERLATGAAEKIVCVSQGVADFCRSRGFAAQKLVVIPNGVDVDRFQRAAAIDLTQFGVRAGRRAILFVGRLDRQKGLDELLGMLPRVFEQVADCDLLLVGDGPERADLQRAAQVSGIQGRVQFAGWQADVPGILAASELLVLPSRWEGMPNVILEAMAAGKPVVAANVEGVAELLGALTAEQTAHAGDKSALASRLAVLLANPPRAKELGSLNQHRAMAEFSLDRMVQKFSDLFQGRFEA